MQYNIGIRLPALTANGQHTLSTHSTYSSFVREGYLRP